MIKLDDVIEALEFVNDGQEDAYYNLETNEIFYSNIGDYEDLNEDELEELFSNSLILPDKHDINEYGMMTDFIETIEDEKLSNQLYIVINGQGAFRRFKDTCINYDIIDDWYKFRDKKYKELALKWCQDNEIEVEQ